MVLIHQVIYLYYSPNYYNLGKMKYLNVSDVAECIQSGDSAYHFLTIDCNNIEINSLNNLIERIQSKLQYHYYIKKNN